MGTHSLACAREDAARADLPVHGSPALFGCSRAYELRVLAPLLCKAGWVSVIFLVLELATQNINL